MKITPLTYKEVSSTLKGMGFVLRSKTATSHEKWIGYRDNTKFVVTVDKHEQPFSVFLISSMAAQAGVSKKQFYLLCKGLESVSSCSHLLVTSDP